LKKLKIAPVVLGSGLMMRTNPFVLSVIALVRFLRVIPHRGFQI
jgi:hypothetical protein